MVEALPRQARTDPNPTSDPISTSTSHPNPDPNPNPNLTGMGSIVEKFQRTNKFGAILGGSEEIMADLGIKMAMARFPDNARL